MPDALSVVFDAAVIVLGVGGDQHVVESAMESTLGSGTKWKSDGRPHPRRRPSHVAFDAGAAVEGVV